MSRRLRIISKSAAVVTLGFLAAMPIEARDVDPLQAPDTQLEPITWSDINGWADDDHAAAFGTFRASCNPFLSRRAANDSRPIHRALREVCRRAAAAGALENDKDKARAFFEENFRPVRIAKLGEKTGLLTGYYEPIVDGSRFPSPEFSAPLYRRPSDMLVGGKKAPKTSLPNRASVGRFNAKKQVESYFDRAAIENGALDGQRLEIAWIKDHWEAMTIQIQGSARVRLEDGTMLRLNYDAHNGHSYTAVGRILIERGLVPQEEMSMDRISQWMAKNPDSGEGSARHQQVVRVLPDHRAQRRHGTARRAGRAADARPLDRGRPHPRLRHAVLHRGRAADRRPAVERCRFRRLMVSQDTGSAIIGPARADLYFGAGRDAGAIAGRIRQQGRFVMLLPRELDMIEAGRAMPLPLPKPVIPARNRAGEIQGRSQGETEG